MKKTAYRTAGLVLALGLSSAVVALAAESPERTNPVANNPACLERNAPPCVVEDRGTGSAVIVVPAVPTPPATSTPAPTPLTPGAVSTPPGPTPATTPPTPGLVVIPPSSQAPSAGGTATPPSMAPGGSTAGGSTTGGGTTGGGQLKGR